MPDPIQLQYLPTRSMPDSPLRRTATTALLLTTLATAAWGLDQAIETTIDASTVLPKLAYLGPAFQLEMLLFSLIFCAIPVFIAVIDYLCLRKLRRGSIPALITAITLLACQFFTAFSAALADTLPALNAGHISWSTLLTTALIFLTAALYLYTLIHLSRLLHSTRNPPQSDPPRLINTT